ncbi:MAG: hypothetical protein KME21_20865 [Desmonostoc vinosum HA7617-LM4]|jgi:hypothetical protein|nr:hypothetical protein [Desmonostoc vinosum HA7617-LM4]
MSIFSVTNTNDSGIGSLRQAISNANSKAGKDIIKFDGIFTDKISDTITLGGSSLIIEDDLSIDGTDAKLLTINGNDASRVLEIKDAIAVEIANLTITGGYSDVDTIGGGGIINFGTLNLSDSIINGNFGYLGSGIYNSGELTLSNSTISKNLADQGGGIYNTGTLTISNSSISENGTIYNGTGGGVYNTGILKISSSTISDNGGGANLGGGIYNSSSGTLTVNSTTISDNNAFYYGGGIYNAGKSTVINSTISGNQITIDNGGGGIYNFGVLTLSNSTISGNQAESGGGIYNEGTTTVSNSTITLNTAYNFYNIGRPGGIYNLGSGTVTVKNSIIAGNFDNFENDSTTSINPDVGGKFISNGFNLIGKLGSSKGFKASEQLNVDITKVLDIKLQINGGSVKTHALVTSSRAINGGNNADIPVDITDLDGDGNTTEKIPFDQRGSGFKRLSGDKVDIGAFEVAMNVINGTAGRNKITGTVGDDIITGFQGKDILTGGHGADKFVYRNIRDAGDIITDFKAGIDKIVLKPLFQSLSLGNLNFVMATSGGYLRFEKTGTDTMILIDPDGSSGHGRGMKMITVKNLSVSAVNQAKNFVF